MESSLTQRPEDWVMLTGYLAFALLLLAFFLRRMIPLRLLAIAASAFFIFYAAARGEVALLTGFIVLLLLNLYRTAELILAHRRMRATVDGRAEVQALVPFMQRRLYASGSVLFLKGDRASAIYYLGKGAVDIPELAKTLKPGTLFGEVGLFTPDRERTASAVCAEDCELLVISDRDILRHCQKDPAFGLFLTKLIAGRMAENQERPALGHM
jgi:CRP/FNR family cyclic AMP-dependent transcriptional regulator